MNRDIGACSPRDEDPVLIGEQEGGTLARERAHSPSGESPFAYRVGRTAGTREMRALILLASFRYLTRFQLEELLFDASPEPLGAARVMTRRVLKRLQNEHLLAAHPRIVGGAAGGSGRTVYSPSAAGLKVVRSLCPGLPRRESGSRRPFLLQHSLATAEVALAFQRSAREMGYRLVEWDFDWGAGEPIGGGVVVPDARLVYANAEYEVEAFVEIDLGTERMGFFAAKLRRYLELYRAGTWRLGHVSWPLVAIVVPDERRALVVARLAQAALQDADDVRTAVEFWIATAERVHNETLGRIWRVVGRDGMFTLLPDG
ncbi:MAG: hypothetical protein E6J20_18320 [Chloroflexi bacterium]|nr:MAG: hypothetical protein E6J20_18320 [Chloroflexota bacterium]